MGSVSRAEGVVAVEVAVRGKLLGHFLALRLQLSLLLLIFFLGQMDALLLVVFFDFAVFGFVEAGVFKQSDFAGLEGFDNVVGRHAVRNEFHFEAQLGAQGFGNRFKSEFRFKAFAFGTAEVAHEDKRSTLFQDVLDAGESGHDAGVVRYFAGAVLGHRHVEVHTHDDSFAFQINVS